jgi:signal transduction histidine kinase
MVNDSAPATVALDDVLLTDELARRPARARDYQAESHALVVLAREMVANPHGVLQKLAELVLGLCHADSAGVSILESDGDKEIFRWHAAAGPFAANLNGTIPRKASPCGTVIECKRVLLFNEAERFFPDLRATAPRIYESLLAPWTTDGETIGTVWAIGHTPDKHFDAEDARLLETLASFAEAAYQMTSALDRARAGQQQLEQRVIERTRLLSESNEKLQAEVEQRRRTEAVLHATERRLEEDLSRSRRLYTLHARLATETDLHAALDEILATACEFTATDRGCVQLVSDDGARLEIVAQRGFRQDSQLIERFRHRGLPQGSERARAERRRVLVEDTATFPGLAGTEDGAAALAEGVRAGQATPMVSRKGETVGVLSTQFRQPHCPSDDELRLVDLLAWTAADFVERRRNEIAVSESEERTAFLLKLSDALRSLADAAEIEQEVARLLGEYLGVNRVLVGEVDGEELVIRRDYVSGVPSLVGRYPLDGLPGKFREACRGGEPLVIHDMQADTRLDDEERAASLAGGSGAMICIGLGGGQRLEAMFCVHSQAARQWTGAQVGMVREVAERAWAALERVRAEEALKEADRRKDEFLATLAHELRNPLAPISNAVQLLRRPDGRRSADGLVELVGRQVRQIVKLVDDLLEISRITRGKIALNRRPVALDAVVRDAVETSRPLVDKARHQLAVSLPGEAMVLYADSVRLTQILSNLINNAAKYTDTGGHIWVSAAREGDQVAISVRDDGVGIAGGQLAHVFEMFTQAHQHPGQAEDGLGIGLAIVRKLVEMHGGSVEAHSPGPRQGSEFIVRLPLYGGAPPGATVLPLAEPQGPLGAQRILVVDDNRDAADTLALLLEGEGATVRTAYEGEAALSATRSFLPTVVLLDLGMPGMDGFEVAQQIRGDPGLHAVRIVALTGWGQEADRNRTRSYGFDHHLTKPVDFNALQAWLAQNGPER